MADLVTEVKATMEKDPVELFEEFESADEVSKTIHQKNLKKAWAYGHGVEVARIDDDDYNYSYSLNVHVRALRVVARVMLTDNHAHGARNAYAMACDVFTFSFLDVSVA